MNASMSQSSHTLRTVLVAAVGMTALLTTARAAERSFVVHAGTVIPVSQEGPQAWSPGTVIVRDGKIVAVGQGLALPADLPVFNMPDATVMPGIVAASSTLVRAHHGDEAIAAGYRAIDSFRSLANYRATLAGGVTTAHLSPGRHRLVTGQGAVIKLGGPDNERVMLDSADLTITLSASAYRPPDLLYFQTPSSSDVALPMPTRQRPTSRIGALLAIEEALAWPATQDSPMGHHHALARLWADRTPLRIQAERYANEVDAIDWITGHKRAAYLVGGAESHLNAERIRTTGLAIVYELGGALRRSDDIGYDPDALERDIAALRHLDGIPVALATLPGAAVVDLRLAASTALRADLEPHRVLAAITRIPAEILGVGDRVGSLEPGKDADLLILSGDPLATSTHVHRVYIGGAVAFEAPESSALVVRGGTIWVNDSERIHDGAILIEDGRISAVGRTVPHPPFARVIDCGADAFITPGLIDAHGHLGLMGDRGSTAPDITLSKLVGAAGRPEMRVAHAGVTTVLLAPYKAAGSGSQISAIHTGGRTRTARIVRDTAGVYFDFADTDPAAISGKLKSRFEAGKKYLEKWQKYEKELAEWQEKMAKGEAIDAAPKDEVSTEADGTPDPLSGTWSVTVSGGPIPEPQTVTMRVRLTGEDVEGRIAIPGAPEEVRVVGTFDGKHLSAEFDMDTGGMGTPKIEADLVEEDRLVGTVAVANVSIDFDAVRTDKTAVEFKVTKRRTRGKDGRPLPPKVDEALEPLRAVLQGHIPALVHVVEPAQIKVVVDFMAEWKTPYVLRNAPGAREHAAAIAEAKAGVVVPTRVVTRVLNRPYHQADDLQRQGIAIAFQSDAEDGARSLPHAGLYAVERGLAADAALAAMTTEVARMFKLENEIGSLQPGCHGDVVVFSGHPFATGSYVKRVIVHGEAVR